MALRLPDLPESPFARLAALIGGLEPGAAPVDLAVGEPKHGVPSFVAPILAGEIDGFGQYPPGPGSADCRAAAGNWLSQRFRLTPALDPDRHVLIVAGTREALFLIAQIVIGPDRRAAEPAVLMPNPFYQSYAAAAVSAGAEPMALPATRKTGFLPDLDAIPDALLARTALFYLCSPANPQGAVASAEYLKTAITLARTHDFVLVVDECYSEIYTHDPPTGALEATQAIGGGFDNLLIFNSLSKRSSLPGLRCGLCAGDPALIAAFARFRNLSAPQVPLPVQAVAAAAWREETHVIANRTLYQAKHMAAARILDGRFGHVVPEGGFFLWLDVAKAGGGERATRDLWQRSGLRVLPGAYLARADADGGNLAADYIRIALVHDLETTEMALNRMAEALDG